MSLKPAASRFSNSDMSYYTPAPGTAFSTLVFEEREDDAQEPMRVDPAADTLPELPETEQLPETD